MSSRSPAVISFIQIINCQLHALLGVLAGRFKRNTQFVFNLDGGPSGCMELNIKVKLSLMYGYDWVLFMMHLVSDISQTGDISESEPILSQLAISLSEIRQENSSADSQADEFSTLVNTEQPQCRICLDNEGEDLIAPCYCRGTQKYVHRSCLDNWRSTKEGFAFSHCTECRATFLLRANVPPDRWWTRLKFQMLVVRDHVLIFIVVQLVVVLLSMIVYRFYGEELREMFGYEQHPYAFYSLAALAIVLVGLLYGFFVAIICGQRINDRHYHVLAKQELTKEYVVLSRDENKNFPELDPSYVTELRNMGLY